MNKTTKIIIVVVLLLAVRAVIALKKNNKADSESKAPENTTENVTAEEMQRAETNTAQKPEVIQ